MHTWEQRMSKSNNFQKSELEPLFMSLFLEEKEWLQEWKRWCHIITISPSSSLWCRHSPRRGAYLTELPLRQGQKLLPLILARSWCGFRKQNKNWAKKVQGKLPSLSPQGLLPILPSLWRFSQWFLYTPNHTLEELTLIRLGVEWGSLVKWTPTASLVSSPDLGLFSGTILPQGPQSGRAPTCTCWASWSLS